MNTALVIIDVQNDFCAGGSLAVPDADAVIPIINDLAHGFRHLFLTQDWHPPGHVSFASSHPGRLPFGGLVAHGGCRRPPRVSLGPLTSDGDSTTPAVASAAHHLPLARIPRGSR